MMAFISDNERVEAARRLMGALPKSNVLVVCRIIELLRRMQGSIVVNSLEQICFFSLGSKQNAHPLADHNDVDRVCRALAPAFIWPLPSPIDDMPRKAVCRLASALFRRQTLQTDASIKIDVVIPTLRLVVVVVVAATGAKVSDVLVAATKQVSCKPLSFAFSFNSTHSSIFVVEKSLRIDPTTALDSWQLQVPPPAACVLRPTDALQDCKVGDVLSFFGRV